MSDILVAMGTRPEVIKLTPIIRQFQLSETPFRILHTGQHHDQSLATQLMEELRLPEPDHTLTLRHNDPTRQMAQILQHTAQTILDQEPSILLVEGDTNTVLATSLAALKTDTPIAHVEAGLRSHDLRMPEEHNRRIVDHISRLLLAPTTTAEANLKAENAPGEIHVTGNTVIDICLQHPHDTQRATYHEATRFDRYILATLHRAENVDNPETLRRLTDTLLIAPLPIVLPLHPRTKNNLILFHLLDRLNTAHEQIQLIPPQGYGDFLHLMKNSELILTDSGGIQEEATAPNIRKRVLVMRESTERPEAVQAGFARIVGTNNDTLLRGIEQALDDESPLPEESPYGDGKAGERIASILRNTLSGAQA
jgi:UDP-N-acetylglucosamine 2-epimerase (non-hydrolysing)